METVYVLQDQSFLSEALPVFVGALAAFMLSMVAFMLRNAITKRSEKRQLMNNLSRELRYNLTVIEDLKKGINAVLPRILAEENDPYVKLRYNKFMGNFIQEAYRGGILFELLSEYDIAMFDDVINHYTDSPESWLCSRLSDLSTGEIETQDAVSSFQYELERLDSHKKVIGDVLDKIWVKENRKN